MTPTKITRTTLKLGTLVAALAGVWPSGLDAQVVIHPRQVMPAAWERYTLSVVNATEQVIVGVRVDVPEAITILGVVPLGDWTFAMSPATDTTPQFIEWSGGQARYPELGEFAFLGRVAGDARKKTLVFPVHVTNAANSVTVYRGRPGAVSAAPTVQIVGRTAISVRGAVALGGAAIGLAALALAMSVLKGPRTSGRST